MDKIETLVQTLSEVLPAKALTVSTAESCTGGWIAKSITDRPGSSTWFEYGFVCYSNQAKANLLGVDPDLITNQGAVSEAVVLAMASGALRRSESNLAVAVSGVAGPDGGTEEKPVGTVWIGWAMKPADDLEVVAKCCFFHGDREAVRRQTVVVALAGVVERVAGFQLV